MLTAYGSWYTGYVQRDPTKTVSLLSANSGEAHACGVAVASGGAGTCWGADSSKQASDGNSITSIDSANIYPSRLGGAATTLAPTAAGAAASNGVLRRSSAHHTAAIVTTAITLMLIDSVLR